MPVELEGIKQEAREPQRSLGYLFLAVNKFKQSYDYTNRFIIQQCPFAILIIFFLEKDVAFHLNKLDSPSPKGCLLSSLVEIGEGGLVVLEKMKM